MVRQLLFRKEYLGTKVVKKQVLEAGIMRLAQVFLLFPLSRNRLSLILKLILQAAHLPIYTKL